MKPPSKGIGQCPAMLTETAGHRGFSLVEIIFALGISSFAIISIIALLPLGLQSSHNSVEESAALNILSAVAADRKATLLTSSSAIYGLPALSASMTAVSGTFGVADNHRKTTTFDHAHYRVVYSFAPPPDKTLNPCMGTFTISWPAQKLQPSNTVEIVVSFPPQ